MSDSAVNVFKLIRNHDQSGVSGIGAVLYGTVFPDGKVVVRWNTSTSSIGIYECLEDFLKIHVLSHPGNLSEMEFYDLEDRPSWTESY